MNKSAIEWTDYTWNPVTGCLHGCKYCYARRTAERGLGEYGKHPKEERFKPRFHPGRLGEPARVKKPSKVFVCSMADLFGSWVPSAWKRAVFDAVKAAPWHTFQFLTKAPANLPFTWPKNCWVGVSVTKGSLVDYATFNLRYVNAPVKFLSFEPLLGPVEIRDPLDWIVVGAQTGPGATTPKAEWVEAILDFADARGVPVFLKDNLHWPERRQEFPR